jgi:von Willebrand factor type A domain
MRRFHGHVVKLVLISALAGCGFNPGQAGSGNVPTGGGISSGNAASSGSGSAATSGNTGVGLNSGGGGDVTGGGGSMQCGVTSTPQAVQPPDVLIVQDKSGSMADDDTDTACNGGCGANSKWSQVSAAMQNVVTATEMSVNWGLKYFSDTSACSAAAAPVVTIGTANAANAIVASYMATTPANNTPTRDAITYGAMYLATLTDSNPKFLLLATDGLPNCPSGCASMRNPSNSCTMTDNPDEDMAAEAAITMAAMMGFPTFVVGIGNVSSAVNTLNQFAINGGEAQTGAATSYYAATDPTSLEAALNAIVGKVASCTVQLQGVPAGQTNVAVSVDDSSGKATEVPEDPTNGWSYTSTADTAIQLNGTYCDGVKNGTYTNIKFYYACDGMPIMIGEESGNP